MAILNDKTHTFSEALRRLKKSGAIDPTSAWHRIAHADEGQTQYLAGSSAEAVASNVSTADSESAISIRAARSSDVLNAVWDQNAVEDSGWGEVDMEKAIAKLECKRKHSLEPTHIRRGHRCDICRKSMGEGSFMRCKKCDFDMCDDCVTQANVEAKMKARVLPLEAGQTLELKKIGSDALRLIASRFGFTLKDAVSALDNIKVKMKIGKDDEEERDASESDTDSDIYAN